MRLTDSHGRVIHDLRVSITDRCNYKCVYCRTGEVGPQYPELAIDDYLRLIRLFVDLGITKVRGQWKLYRGKTLVMPTYHPSYLLRPSPQQTDAKRQTWEDLQLVMKELGLTVPTRESRMNAPPASVAAPSSIAFPPSSSGIAFPPPSTKKSE